MTPTDPGTHPDWRRIKAKVAQDTERLELIVRELTKATSDQLVRRHYGFYPEQELFPVFRAAVTEALKQSTAVTAKGMFWYPKSA